MKFIIKALIFSILILKYSTLAYTQTVFLTLEEKQQIEQLNQKAEISLQDNAYEKAANHYKDIAIIYKSKNLRGLAIQFLKKSAYSANKAENNYLVHDVNQELSLLFVDLGQHENAIEPLEKACEAMSKAKAFHSQAAGLINLGRILSKILRTEDALMKYKIAEELLLPLEDNVQLLTLCYIDMIEIYTVKKDEKNIAFYKSKLNQLQKSEVNSKSKNALQTDTSQSELQSVQIFNDSLKVVSDSILKASKHQLEDELRRQLNVTKQNVEQRNELISQFKVYLAVTIFISIISIIIVLVIQLGRHRKLKFVIDITNKELDLLRSELTNIKSKVLENESDIKIQ